MGPQGTTLSPSAAVYALLANSSSGPRSLEVWLGDIAMALGGRHATLVALLDNEPVVQYFSGGDSELSASVSWPWSLRQQSGHAFKAAAAVATPSTDGKSSFLTAAVEHEGILWVLCLEDGPSRTWTVDEQSAVTMAVLGLFQFVSIPEESQKWVKWSQKVRLQQRLEQAAGLVGRMVHEFNNVLTGIIGFTELSLAQMPPGTTQKNFMGEVYVAAQQGSQLLNRLGLFSARKMLPQNLTTSLTLTLAEQENRLRKASGGAITLEVLVPADLPALAIDLESLRTILDKLLDNAHEAIRTTGKVILSARPVELTRQDGLELLGKTSPGSYVEITVSDSGGGFSAEARQRVFVEPFYSTKPRHRGLGLVSVYGIVSNHGGGIRLEHGLQSGALVRVYLPTARRVAEARLPDATASGRACQPEGEQKKGSSAPIAPTLFLGRRVG